MKGPVIIDFLEKVQTVNNSSYCQLLKQNSRCLWNLACKLISVHQSFRETDHNLNGDDTIYIIEKKTINIKPITFNQYKAIMPGNPWKKLDKLNYQKYITFEYSLIFNKENCYKLMKFVSQRIRAIIKARGGGKLNINSILKLARAHFFAEVPADFLET